MHPAFSPRSSQRATIVTRIAVAALLTTIPLTAAFAAPSAGQPEVLGTQQGINDGQGGIVLQTAPFSHAPIVQAQPIAKPVELAPDSSGPIVVEPYIAVPGSNGGYTGYGGSSNAARAMPTVRPMQSPQ
jgi:hypothetical protein